MEANKMREKILYSYSRFTEIRDRMKRTLGLEPRHPLIRDYENRANELAQLGCCDDLVIKQHIEEIRERVAYVELGVKHPKRVDSEDMDCEILI